MAKREANPNTAYGRKRLRNEYYERKANLTPEQRASENSSETILYLIIILVIVGILYLVGGSGAVLKWFTR